VLTEDIKKNIYRMENLSNVKGKLLKTSKYSIFKNIFYKYNFLTFIVSGLYKIYFNFQFLILVLNLSGT